MIVYVATATLRLNFNRAVFNLDALIVSPPSIHPDGARGGGGGVEVAAVAKHNILFSNHVRTTVREGELGCR